MFENVQVIKVHYVDDFFGTTYAMGCKIATDIPSPRTCDEIIIYFLYPIHAIHLRSSAAQLQQA